MKKDVRCAVIGQHPLRFPWGFDEEDDGCRRMKLEMAQRIMELSQRGVTEFRVACDPGVGLYAAEIINILRDARNWTASTSMSSLTPSFWPISGSSNSRAWCWPSMPPDLADGSAEDKAVSYALALGRPVMLIHPETLKTKWLNVPTEKAPG